MTQPVLSIPTVNRVRQNIGKQQEPPVLNPHRPFGPLESLRDDFHFRVSRNQIVNGWIEPLDDAHGARCVICLCPEQLEESHARQDNMMIGAAKNDRDMRIIASCYIK